MKTLFGIILLSFVLSVNAIINIPSDEPTIQSGINIATDGDTVLVQPGTYYENLNFTGKAITICSLYQTTQDTSYISQTIINGNQNGSVVNFLNSETFTSKLNGFTITGGTGYCLDSFGYYGGGIYCSGASPTLMNLNIKNNNVNGRGGGISCYPSSSPIIENVIISNNSAGYGGGIYCLGYSSPILTNVTLSSNNSGYGGGASFMFYSNPVLLNSIISDNFSNLSGSGIHCLESEPILINSTFTNNIANNSGGGIFADENSHIDVTNCILYNNTPQEIFLNEDYEPSSIVVSYSDIEGGETEIVINNGTAYWLEGNFNEDPLFTGSEIYPYSLSTNSPCIDAGTPDTTGLNIPEFDILYNPRIFGNNIDIGAYEWNGSTIINDHISAVTNNKLTNYPNPFNPSTTIEFSIQNDSNVELVLYNIKGQRIKILYNNQLAKGYHSIIWNGDDKSGKTVASGIYYYKLNINGKTEAVKKCLLLK